MTEPERFPWEPWHWPTWIGLGLLRLFSLLPLPVLNVIGAGLGMLVYLAFWPRRRVVHRNIARCFPEWSAAQHGRMTRRHFRAFGQTMFDLAIAWWGSAPRLRRVVRLRNEHYFTDARAAGRNVILLVPHFIGLEIGGIRLTLDHKMVDVFRHPKNAVLRAVMARQRTRFSGTMIEHNAPMTALVRAIKAGTPFHYLPDQNAPRRKGVFAPFFGIATATFPTLPRLARMTGAVVIPCVTYQLSWGRGYEIVFGAPLENYPTDDVQADIARMNLEIEQAVRRHPEQYFWMHRRFKTRPTRDEPDFYE
jgi:KDO2-lipid IV(A) lauroyltransferase